MSTAPKLKAGSGGWCPKCHSRLRRSGVTVKVKERDLPVLECSGRSCKLVFVPLVPAAPVIPDLNAPLTPDEKPEGMP